MLSAIQTTSRDAYYEHSSSGQSAAQRARILYFIKSSGGDWSIGELAQALDMEKSTVSPRVNELLYKTCELVAKTKRKDAISGITIRPVGLPLGQGELFQ